MFGMLAIEYLRLKFWAATNYFSFLGMIVYQQNYQYTENDLLDPHNDSWQLYLMNLDPSPHVLEDNTFVNFQNLSTDLERFVDILAKMKHNV